MAPFIVHQVDQDVEVRVTREMPALSATLAARVDAIWVQAAARVAASGAGQLFTDMWQLCPAGRVDAGEPRSDGTMDFRGQLLTEPREEPGLDPSVASDVTPLCVEEHPGSHVADFAMAVGTTLRADAIPRAHRDRGNGEYDPLRIVPIPDLRAFILWAGAAGAVVSETPGLAVSSPDPQDR